MNKRRERPKKENTRNLFQYGLFDIPSNFDTGLGNNFDDEGDSDLEAELAALSGGSTSKPQRKKPAKKLIPQHELDAMVADSIKDIGSDDDVSVDEDDPELLGELNELQGVYKQHETQAKEEGNSSKARRYGRIAKQYEQAIKLHKAGKPIPVDELPTPPEYGPIPIEGATKPTQIPEAPAQSSLMPQKSNEEAEDSSQKDSPKSRTPVNRVASHADQQVLILVAKQTQFKQAAFMAKKQGEITRAKEFLRQAKGFDKLIQAATAGLPVDWSSIPVSPEAKSQLDNEYDIVMSEECSEERTEDFDVLAHLENQLQEQLKICLTRRDHNKALEDVAGANRFERLALNVSKHLDFIRKAKKIPGLKVPKFH